MHRIDFSTSIGRSGIHWLGLAMIVVLGVATIEGVVRSLVGARQYDWRAYAASLADAVARRGIDALGLSIAAPVLSWAFDHRLQTIALNTAEAIALLFIGQEFCYYWYHRAAHRVGWFWATHSVHHSPNELTLASALRLGWTGKLTGTALFFAPLVWLGYPPVAVAATLGANLLYQFWLHAPWMPRLGPLEWVLNTPTHHKVHHASNAAYLDCNYGGVLILFDRFFGTFVELRDDVAPRYGLSTPLLSHNPLRIVAHGWFVLFTDMRRASGARGAFRVLLGPPIDHAGEQPGLPSGKVEKGSDTRPSLSGTGWGGATRNRPQRLARASSGQPATASATIPEEASAQRQAHRIQQPSA